MPGRQAQTTNETMVQQQGTRGFVGGARPQTTITFTTRPIQTFGWTNDGETTEVRSPIADQEEQDLAVKKEKKQTLKLISELKSIISTLKDAVNKEEMKHLICKNDIISIIDSLGTIIDYEESNFKE